MSVACNLVRSRTVGPPLLNFLQYGAGPAGEGGGVIAGGGVGKRSSDARSAAVGFEIPVWRRLVGRRSGGTGGSAVAASTVGVGRRGSQAEESAAMPSNSGLVFMRSLRVMRARLG